MHCHTTNAIKLAMAGTQEWWHLFTPLLVLVLGDIEKLRCRYDMRKISRYNDIHDISCMVLFRKQTILFVYIRTSPLLIYILVFK